VRSPTRRQGNQNVAHRWHDKRIGIGESIPEQSNMSDSMWQVTGEAPPFTENYHASREQVIAWFESAYARWLVERAQGNISAAARMAGVERTTVYRLLQRCGGARTEVVHPEPVGSDA
jgi:DNA-binding NtrC family response regulator